MRKPPLKLEQLSILKARTALCTEKLNELDYLMTGFVGEVEFDRVLDEYIQGTNNIHLKDYRFKTKTDANSFRKVDTKSSEVQIDSLLISKNRIFTFEIKNYNQDLIYGDTDWQFLNGDIFRTPMAQISRQNHELKVMLKDSPQYVDVFSCIVFINLNQTIYNLPSGKNILVRSNLSKFLQRNIGENNYNYEELVKHLESRKVHTSMYDSYAKIDFNELKPGVYCPKCYQELFRENKNRYVCKKCEKSFDILTMTKRLIEEMKILNPEWPINTRIISSLSGGNISKTSINKYRKLGLLYF
jgi:Zn finger protein HypA/HybF involved in hydrogenase expression